MKEMTIGTLLGGFIAASCFLVGSYTRPSTVPEPKITIQTSATSTESIPLGRGLTQLDQNSFNRDQELARGIVALSKQIQGLQMTCNSTNTKK